MNSQFSGDESRRLFTSGAKVPETTMDNGKLGVITYGSVVFQLKDADLEANGTCDFVFRGLKVLCKTRVVTASLILLFILPVLMFIFGEYPRLISIINSYPFAQFENCSNFAANRYLVYNCLSIISGRR